jgi:hypothetical protein
MSTRTGFLFGVPFFGFGIYAILIGAKIAPIDPASVHAPYWVLTACGVAFAAGGLMVWSMAWKQHAAQRRRMRALQAHPNEPALADYPWNAEGYTVSEWPTLVKSIASTIVITIFLSIFNWMAFRDDAVFFKVVVGVLDIIPLVMWGLAGRQLGRAIKFGQSRIRFERFPYRPNEPVVIFWELGAGISQIRNGTFTLRCVEEWMETRGRGDNSSTVLIHEETWRGTWFLDKPRNLLVKDDVKLCYKLPFDAPTTQLSADKPVFWELEVKLDLSGLDFNATYLAPVYNSNSGPASETSSRV